MDRQNCRSRSHSDRSGDSDSLRAWSASALNKRQSAGSIPTRIDAATSEAEMRTSPQHCYGWPRLVWLILIAFIHGIAITGFPANSARPLGVSELQAVRFDQRLDQQISLDLNFLDDSGRQTRLQSYFDQKPVLLILGYYGCPMLCGLVLNGVVESLQDL